MTAKEQQKIYADYYYRGEPLISDEEYDAFCKANDLAPGLAGSEFSTDEEKCSHILKTGTLSKCADIDEFKDWHKKQSNKKWNVSTKIDGSGGELIFKDGKFIKAITRGDGETGLDRTDTVKEILSKYSFNGNFTGSVRGEFVIFKKDFDDNFKATNANGRNMVAGIMNRKFSDLTVSKKGELKFVHFIAYDALNYVSNFKTQTEIMNFLTEFGFEVPEWETVETIDYKHLEELRDNIRNHEYDCDGVVIKSDTIDYDDRNKLTPSNDIALKPELQVAVSKVVDIEWDIRGSFMAPVAIVEPVSLEGTTVERASLSNINIMNKLGIYIGADVCICKRGMIIPQVIKVLNPKENAFEVPTVCPVCGEVLEVNSSGMPVCPNEDCPRKLGHRFARMFDTLEVKGCGPAFISNLENNVSSVKEFLDLINSEAKEIDEFAGGINGRKIVKAMKKALNTPITIPEFLAMFDKKGFDVKKLNLLSKYSLEELHSLSVEEIKKIDGFADITANMFVEFINNCWEEINILLPYFTIKEVEIISGGKLDGLSFCFTGAACKPRKELEAIVNANGGTVKSGVAKGLSYLVTDDTTSGSAKNVKAAQLGIPVISSTAFLEMV